MCVEENRHAQSVLGICNLPMNVPVEIEVIVKIREYENEEGKQNGKHSFKVYDKATKEKIV